MDATTQVHNSSLETNLEQRKNITVLTNNFKNNINYNNTINVSRNRNNINVSDSISVSENLHNPFSRSKIGDKSSANATYDNSQKASSDEYLFENETEGNEDSYDSDEQNEQNEQMQYSSSTDYYNDEDDSTYSDIYDSDEEEEPEVLPEAKELVQLSIRDRKILDDDAEDMGYDEDDERIAIAIDRPKELRARVSDDFINEEGSGSHERKSFQNPQQENIDSRLGFDYLNSRQTQQKQFTDHSHSQVGVVATEVDLRESSGNFANDDEDNDDESDDDDDSDGFFNSKRRSNGRYFRKNTNDAIKIISTPLGKVGIVYQQTATHADGTSPENNDKKSTSFTDFDALSPDPESSHRLASSHPKITPVLTADGKVALLYRGDSENSKYEPIRNLTSHTFNKANDPSSDRKKVSSNNADSSSGSSEYSDLDSAGDIEEGTDFRTPTNKNNNKSNIDDKLPTEEQAAILPAPNAAPTTGSFIIRPTDSVLPMINRPLSEVLGIKKNQFKQFRVKDMTTTTEGTSGALSAINIDNSEVNTLHYLAKVNLADYPTSSRTRNYDFDFSRDNTMLDERSRSKEYRSNTEINSDQQIINTNEAMNEDILSKTEVVNLAIVPHFDEELERLQRLREYEDRRHHRQRQKESDKDLSGIHCIMQAMMGIAAISTVFGMLGTFFKQRILDQLRLMHW